MAIIDALAAPKGSTGNNTHAGVPGPDESESIALRFIVEAVGGTPTVTWKFQGSSDPLEVADGASTWVDVDYQAPGAEASANTTRVMTAVGTDLVWIVRGLGNKFYRKFRVVTTSNTNVTYRAEITSLEASN